MTTSLVELVHDAYRFIMYHKATIESSPLQVYGSALLCSPTGSRIRETYRHENPDWITITPAMNETWNRCLQTFEFAFSPISIVFSLDSNQITAGYEDGTVRVWDIDSGSSLQTFQYSANGNKDDKYCFGFGSTWLVSGFDGYRRNIWDARTGSLKKVFERRKGEFATSTFSHDSVKLASAGRSGEIGIWDIEAESCLQKLTGHTRRISTLAFSPDSTLVVSTSDDEMMRVWDTNSGECLHTFKERYFRPTKIGFSYDSTKVAVGSLDGLIKVCDIRNGACLKSLEAMELAVDCRSCAMMY